MTSLWLAVFGKSSNKVDRHGDSASVEIDGVVLKKLVLGPVIGSSLDCDFACVWEALGKNGEVATTSLEAAVPKVSISRRGRETVLAAA
jgi:hypothetical protein